MNDDQLTDTANHFSIQRLLMRYFAGRPCYDTVIIGGTTAIVEPARHRTGLPVDAETRRYVITNVTAGWSVIVRTVWRNGILLQPAATHTRIDHYLDDGDRFDDDETVVSKVFNQWLFTLDL